MTAVPAAATPAAPPDAPPRSLYARLTASRLLVKLFFGFLILGAWEVGVRNFAAPFVARPMRIAEMVPQVLSDPAYWEATWSTLWAVIVGLVIAMFAGTLIGLLMGRVRAADRMLDFYVNGFYTMPMIAVLPLLTVWFGYSEEARLATVVFAALFSVVINVSDGARSVPREFIEVARAYRTPGRVIWFDITLMSALPYLIAGIRLAAGRSLVGAVLAEIFASIEGQGMYILANARALQQNEAVVGVLMLAGFGIGFDALMNWVLRRWFPWYRRDEAKND
jgi:ABC-type nitrate/sulfonate/bicarbonate transport system permease component